MKPVAEMTEQEKDQVRAWIRNWEVVGAVLERERIESIRRVDTTEAIKAMEPAYEWARLHWSPRKSSGLVEQQRLFMRARLHRERQQTEGK